MYIVGSSKGVGRAADSIELLGLCPFCYRDLEYFVVKVVVVVCLVYAELVILLTSDDLSWTPQCLNVLGYLMLSWGGRLLLKVSSTSGAWRVQRVGY